MEMSFEEFNRGGRGRPVRGRGQGRGGVVVAGEVREKREKREYTEAETRKYEAVKARRKEKVKARKAELRESKKKEREAAGGAGEWEVALPRLMVVAIAAPVAASVETTPKVDGPAKSKPPKGKSRQKVDATVSSSCIQR